MTETGLRTALFFTRSYDRLLRPALSAFDPKALDSDLRRSFQALESAMHDWCEREKLAA